MLPSRAELFEFLERQDEPVGLSDICRHFSLRSTERKALRAFLNRCAYQEELPGRLKASAQVLLSARLRITGYDRNGSPVACFASHKNYPPDALIFVRPPAKGQPAPVVGEEVFARIKPVSDGNYEGRILQRGGKAHFLAVFQGARMAKGSKSAPLLPLSPADKTTWTISPEHEAGLKPSDILLVSPVPSSKHGPRPVEIIENLGQLTGRNLSKVAAKYHKLPDTFPPEVLSQAERFHSLPISVSGREDLRSLAFVTIDDKTARDFDDAVFAASTPDGFCIIIAIADVAHYVKVGTAIDEEAKRRGNSVYFPDQVLPMLPEALSEQLCSLQPHQDRLCVFLRVKIDPRGNTLHHAFGRGIIRSRARLTYDNFESARSSPAAFGLEEGALDNLHNAHQALKVRFLEDDHLERPELDILLDDDGTPGNIVPKEHLESRQMIKHFMVLANICAAETLSSRNAPAFYRAHPGPSGRGREVFRNFVISLYPQLAHIKAEDAQSLLKSARHLPLAALIHTAFLREQGSAFYSLKAQRHAGLNLPRYTHFTSPIRRYADIVVHRALVKTLGLGDDEAPTGDGEALAQHLTRCERRAVHAESFALRRFIALYLLRRRRETLEAVVSSLHTSGIFVTLKQIGAKGRLVPAAAPGGKTAAKGKEKKPNNPREKTNFSVGDELCVQLQSANIMSGELFFSLAGGDAMI